MTKTSQGRFQAAMTAYYPLFAMSKANLVSLGVFERIWARFLGLRVAPLAINVWYGPPAH